MTDWNRVTLTCFYLVCGLFSCYRAELSSRDCIAPKPKVIPIGFFTEKVWQPLVHRRGSQTSAAS